MGVGHPLQDHFRPPLSVRRHWQAFHNAWATYIASDLNRRLPPGYFAEPNVQFGIEIDVAAFDETPVSGDPLATDGGERGLPPSEATSWAPSAPVLTIPFPLVTDTVEVLLYESEAGPTLAGAIELVSPANRDRSEHRDAFVAKCETYLQQGVGLVMVDAVTTRRANLHVELLQRYAAEGLPEAQHGLYTAAYRPIERDGEPSLEVWQQPLDLGSSLPTMPLWLRGSLCLPVDLEATYDRTCTEHRILSV